MAHGRVGQCAVVVTLAAIGRQRDADPEGVDCVLEAAKAENAHAEMEIRP